MRYLFLPLINPVIYCGIFGILNVRLFLFNDARHFFQQKEYGNAKQDANDDSTEYRCPFFQSLFVDGRLGDDIQRFAFPWGQMMFDDDDNTVAFVEEEIGRAHV